MNLYKVAFANNVAVSAERMYVPHHDSVRVEAIAGKRLIKWITVFADDERESMKVANKTIDEFFDILHIR